MDQGMEGGGEERVSLACRTKPRARNLREERGRREREGGVKEGANKSRRAQRKRGRGDVALALIARSMAPLHHAWLIAHGVRGPSIETWHAPVKHTTLIARGVRNDGGTTGAHRQGLASDMTSGTQKNLCTLQPRGQTPK